MRWLVLGAVALGVLACHAGRGDGARRRDPGALVVARAADAQALDPILVTDSESYEVATLVFEGLVRWKPGTTDIVPGLATAWRTSPDGRTWTFELRRGVRFHDGTPLDAAAVVFSFDRLLDPAHPNYVGEPAAYRRSLLRGITDVVAVDPHTVAIHVARPYAPLLGDLALFPIVSPLAVTARGPAFAAAPVGTGPFAFESWTRGEQIVVRRFDGYWGPAPTSARVVFRVIVDARQRLVELESGSVDLAMSILPDEQSFVELHPDLVLHATPGNDVSYLAFNTRMPYFADARVRRAISHAVNKEPIVKLAYQGRAVAAEGPLPPTQWAHHTPRATYGYDPALARRLLAEARAAGAIAPGLVLTLYAPATPRPYLAQPERVARFLQAALAQVGLPTRLVLLPYADHKAMVEAGQHDLALFGWIGDTGDPDSFLGVLFHSDHAVPPGATNIAFYRDAAVDRALAEAQAAADDATRAARYAEVQDRIAADAPWVPLAHSELVVAARAELEGVVLSPLGHPIYALVRRAGAR